MSLTENSNQVFLPGDATNSQNSPYISVWPLDQDPHYSHIQIMDVEKDSDQELDLVPLDMSARVF